MTRYNNNREKNWQSAFKWKYSVNTSIRHLYWSLFYFYFYTFFNATYSDRTFSLQTKAIHIIIIMFDNRESILFYFCLPSMIICHGINLWEYEIYIYCFGMKGVNVMFAIGSFYALFSLNHCQYGMKEEENKKSYWYPYLFILFFAESDIVLLPLFFITTAIPMNTQQHTQRLTSLKLAYFHPALFTILLLRLVQVGNWKCNFNQLHCFLITTIVVLSEVF